jgi:hypothetical protein
LGREFVMGDVMDRSKRFFVKFDSSFEQAFPTLEDAVIEYTEMVSVKQRSLKRGVFAMEVD